MLLCEWNGVKQVCDLCLMFGKWGFVDEAMRICLVKGVGFSWVVPRYWFDGVIG